MISAGQFRNGITIEYENEIYQVIEFQHVKPGKGAAFVRCKIKNIVSGGAVEHTFRPNEKFPRAHIDRSNMQYLYQDVDGDLYHFMDAETFEQIAIDGKLIKDDMKFVRENDTIEVVSHEGNVFSVEPDLIVELEIAQTEPGLKGDTSSGATKPAQLETGIEIIVPLFIGIGDKVKVDTRTGEYVGRA